MKPKTYTRLSLIFFLGVLLLLSSCRKKKIFRDPPVSPVVKIVKVSSIIGYCSTVAWAHFKGHNIPDVITADNGNSTIFYINTATNYPYAYNTDDYDEVIAVASKISDNTMFMTLFFIETNIGVGRFKLINVRTIPVLYHGDKLKAVYASQDINFGNDTLMEISLTDGEIQAELLKLNLPNPTSEQIAIDQNAWIIDVDFNQSLGDLDDDVYTISGGEQEVEVYFDDELQEATILQMAMIGVEINSDCLRNPVAGIAFLQNVEVTDDAEETVIGQAFYDFYSTCDGKMDVVVGTGNFVRSTGDRIELGY